MCAASSISVIPVSKLIIHRRRFFLPKEASHCPINTKLHVSGTGCTPCGSVVTKQISALEMSSGSRASPTVTEFAEQLSQVNNWFELGSFLGVSIPELEQIQIQHQSDGTLRCLMELFHYIERLNLSLSWSQIAIALDKMKNHRLAKHIREKFCKLSLEAADSSSSSSMECSSQSLNTTELSGDPVQSPVEMTSPLANGSAIFNLPSVSGAIPGPNGSSFNTGATPGQLGTEQSFSDDDDDMDSISEDSYFQQPLKIPLDSGSTKKLSNIPYKFTKLEKAIISELEKNSDLDAVRDFVCDFYEMELIENESMKALLKRVSEKAQSHEEYVRFLENLVENCLTKKEGLKKKIDEYDRKRKNFFDSCPLKSHLDKVNKPHSGKQSVVLKLPEFWSSLILRKFESILQDLFRRSYEHLHLLRVTDGCICLSWITTDTELVKQDAREFSDLLISIGVIRLKVGGRTIVKKKDNEMVTLETLILEAQRRDNNHAVEILFDVSKDFTNKQMKSQEKYMAAIQHDVTQPIQW